MRLGVKLDEWQSAALIDAETAAAIRAHEEGGGRPIALFAIAGLGVFALALGILSVVAANWDTLPAWLKLTAHLVAMAGTGAAAYLFSRRNRTWATEIALFLLAALTLAGIALHSQVYQVTGPLWQALGWWALLASPMLLALARTRLIAVGYGSMLVALAIAYVTERTSWFGENLAAALPPALVIAALALPADDRRTPFRVGLYELGLALALVAASVAHIAWVESTNAVDASAMWQRLPLPALLVAVACALARRRPRSEAILVATILVGALVASVLALGFAHGDGPLLHFVGLASFLLLWGAVAAAASRAGWSRLFGLAIAAIAVRLFLVYIELFYSLAFTGVGLMVGGVLLIALAWGWTRVVRAGR